MCKKCSCVKVRWRGYENRHSKRSINTHLYFLNNIHIYTITNAFSMSLLYTYLYNFPIKCTYVPSCGWVSFFNKCFREMFKLIVICNISNVNLSYIKIFLQYHILSHPLNINSFVKSLFYFDKSRFILYILKWKPHSLISGISDITSPQHK